MRIILIKIKTRCINYFTKYRYIVNHRTILVIIGITMINQSFMPEIRIFNIKH